MGAFNYKKDDYITLAIMPYDHCAEQNNDEDPDWDCSYRDDEINFNSIYKDYDFEYFNFELIPGYHEGLQLVIENNLPSEFNDSRQKREAQKEITKVKEMLIRLAGCGFSACEPGWCSSYSNYTETVEKIKKAVKAMRNEVNSILTWFSYSKKIA